MIVKIYTGRMAEIIVEAAEVPDAVDLVRVLVANGITAAKIVKSKTRLEAPGIEVAHQQGEPKQ